MPLFANLLGFFLLAAVPAVTVIYLLRRRYKRFDVPSLMFWDFPDQIRDGGRALNPEKLPPIFWLEILIVILCALAAATPYLLSKTHKQTLAIVVDGSASMSAHSDEISAYAGAWQSLKDEAKNPAWRDVVVIRAATNPERLDLADVLKNGWDVSAATADMSSAIDMARAQIPEDGHILVLSDAAPQNTADAATVE